MALPQSMDPELRRQIEAAADRGDESVDAWLALEREKHPEQDRPTGIRRAPSGKKPKPLRNPSRLLDGSKMSDAIIEDRR